MHKYQILEKGKPLAEAQKAIILLHGRGADAEDIISLADEFCDDTFYIVAPQATNNAWYPFSFMTSEDRNEPWLTSAVNTVKRLLEEISVYLPSEKIYISGFSQGACLALEVTTRYAVKYGGVIAFSGGLIGETIRTEKYRGNFEGTKVFIGNSDKDPHIPLIRCQESENLMKLMGADVTLKIYPDMPHTIIRDEIDTVRKLMF
jgi:phospholipase/carboxylesterase